VPLRRLLVFVSLALVVDTSAYAAITPLLPGLSDDYGLDKATAGVLAAAYPAGTLLLSIPAAWLVSRIGAKHALIAGLATLAVSSLAFALAGSTGTLIGARFIQGGAAAAMWAGALAWLVGLAPRERRAEALGTAIGAAIAGALAGPILGAVADAIGIAAVFGAYVAVPLAMIVWAVRMPGVEPVPGMGIAALRTAIADSTMRRGMWLMMLPALGFGVIGVLVPLKLDDLGAGAALIAAAFLGAVGLEALMSPYVGRIADRRGRIWPARIGLAGGGVALLLLPLPERIALVVIGVVLAAPLLGMLWAPAMALLSDGAEARGLDVALGFGLANLAWGSGAAIGASGGGALAKATVDAAPYLLVAALAVFTAWQLGRQKRERPALQGA
jgi:predicted MFS family arabinose efflux permease